jgi:hypothetical protein
MKRFEAVRVVLGLALLSGCASNPSPCSRDPNLCREEPCAEAPSPACCTYWNRERERIDTCESIQEALNTCAFDVSGVNLNTTACCLLENDAGMDDNSPCCTDPDGSVCVELNACNASPTPACCAQVDMHVGSTIPYSEPCLNILNGVSLCNPQNQSSGFPGCCENASDAGIYNPYCAIAERDGDAGG